MFFRRLSYRSILISKLVGELSEQSLLISEVKSIYSLKGFGFRIGFFFNEAKHFICFFATWKLAVSVFIQIIARHNCGMRHLTTAGIQPVVIVYPG